MYLQFEALEALRPHDIPRPIARVSVSNSNTTILLDEVFVECPQHSDHDKQRRTQYWNPDFRVRITLFLWLRVPYLHRWRL